jgi:hypothetical protein
LRCVVLRTKEAEWSVYSSFLFLSRRHGRGREVASFRKLIRIYVVFIHLLAYNMIYQFYAPLFFVSISDAEHAEAIIGRINASNRRNW